MTLRPLEKTHTGVPEMSTFKTHPPAPSRSTSPFFPVPWLFSGEASGHLARVLGGSSPSCPLFQGTREGGKGPTVGLDLGFPAAKPAKGPVHKEAGDPSVGWAAPALLVWTPAWVWGGGPRMEGLSWGITAHVRTPPHSNIPPLGGSKEGVRHQPKDTVLYAEVSWVVGGIGVGHWASLGKWSLSPQTPWRLYGEVRDPWGEGREASCAELSTLLGNWDFQKLAPTLS